MIAFATLIVAILSFNQKK
ncbi:MAG: hypothetical protein LKI15_24850 [Aneurinibacillus aneurinilyticus]|nr:hypothetical protein [Aneurinibacillus aneurinilyticus]